MWQEGALAPGWVFRAPRGYDVTGTPNGQRGPVVASCDVAEGAAREECSLSLSETSVHLCGRVPSAQHGPWHTAGLQQVFLFLSNFWLPLL